jgi:hypothetical protein
MFEFIWLIRLIRQVEVLLLPLLPAAWRTPAPSYRLTRPLLDRVSRYKDRPWAHALLYTVEYQIYPPYHRWGLASDGLAPRELHWMRAVVLLLVVGIGLLLVPGKEDLAVYCQGALLLAGVSLLTVGAMGASAPALWAAWMIVFVLLAGLLSPQLSPGLLALCVLAMVWHMPLLARDRSWRWYDVLATCPALFFWLRTSENLLPGLSVWASAGVTLALWTGVWASLASHRTPGRLRDAAALFWPALILATAAVMVAGPALRSVGIVNHWRYVLWLASAGGLALLGAVAAPLLTRVSVLHRRSVVIGAFVAYFAAAFLLTEPEKVAEGLQVGLKYLHYWMTPLRWFFGAMVLLFVRHLAASSAFLIQAALARYILPIGVALLTGRAVASGWTDPLRQRLGALASAAGMAPRSAEVVGFIALLALAGLFLGGLIVLAARRRDERIGPWLFWWILPVVLFNHYHAQVEEMVAQHEATGAVTDLSILKWSLVILWLTYVYLGDQIRAIRERIPGVAAVALVGALMCFTAALPWLAGDARREVQSVINYDLMTGFAYVGVPMLVYVLVVRPFLQKRGGSGLAWGAVVLGGILLVQLLQGVEHVTAAWVEGVSPTVYRDMRVQAMASAALEYLVPPCARSLTWALGWRAGRWLAVFAVAVVVLRRQRRTGAEAFFTVLYAAFAAATAEAVWIYWPGLDEGWAVLLRPMRQTAALWEGAGLFESYLLYGPVGAVCGLMVAWWAGRRSGAGPAGADAKSQP